MKIPIRDRLAFVPFACYALLLAVWLVDLFTPQMFVGAILMNGPIALSSIVLRRDLTIRLVVLAEIANATAAYFNGVQAHHWDAIALGDRALLAASFLLVGFMSAQTQIFAREAGASSLRSLQMRNEQALRRAIDRVRASLSPDLVERAIVREVLGLVDGGRSSLYTRSSLLNRPQVLQADERGADIRVAHLPLPAEAASVVNRLSNEAATLLVRVDDAAGRFLLQHWEVETLLVARLQWKSGEETLLFVLPRAQHRFEVAEYDIFAAFAQQAALALAQSALFERLAQQNDEIAAQRNTLAQRNQVIRDIVYALAHDLRTPLSAANSTMRHALAGAYGELPEGYKEVVQTSIMSNDELRRLAETLLLAARYELGDVREVTDPVNLGQLCAAAVREMEPVAADREITFVFDDEAGTEFAVKGDAGELRRATINLVANALLATPAGGHVTLRLLRHDAVIAIQVEDDGYGVPVERRASLFERFGLPNASSAGGTGLGLGIVRRIAEKHGGKASYSPRTEGGSVFAIELPAERAE